MFCFFVLFLVLVLFHFLLFEKMKIKQPLNQYFFLVNQGIRIVNFSSFLYPEVSKEILCYYIGIIKHQHLM